MGNHSTKEARGPDSSSSHALRRTHSGTPGPASPADRLTPVYSSRSTRERGERGSRPELSFLGLGSSAHSSQADGSERRETRVQREARKAEKERVARVKEREKSLKEEHVDGGYLVTMGVYTGPEDFNKSIVRQLMIERRMAPFWRGLDDFKEEWTEHQLVAAGRGLPIPAADEIPPEGLTRPLSSESTQGSEHNLHLLMPTISSHSQLAASDAAATLSPSHSVFTNSTTTSPTSPTPALTHSSPFRPRAKTVASLASASKNPSSSEIVPREAKFPKDASVNGQAIEVYLYKDSAECPICFMYYPPYLNKTRCCDQAICSECFVQIKRPDPHPPEHHGPPMPPTELGADPEALVSEPACCPYCQQPEFGVTYEAPPFRRGLTYANAGTGNIAATLSPTMSINSAGAIPALLPATQKRRTTSISANSSTVITTDRVRPDWSVKLETARSNTARRAAAATAMHTAAYLTGHGNTSEPRGFGLSGRSRFGRSRNENSPGPSGAVTPSQIASEPTPRSASDQLNLMRREAQEVALNRSRIEDLEEMMMMEAIRQSLAAEEERKKKAEKEAAKEAKKKAKEEKRKEKRETKRGVYGHGSSSASASALSLSLPTLGFGGRRASSGINNLQREITPGHLEPKGKGVDRSTPGVVATGGYAPIDFSQTENSSGHGQFGAHHPDPTASTVNDSPPPSAPPSASPTAPERASHLRQMSNASSPASSFAGSGPGSLRNDSIANGSSSTIDLPNASGINPAANQGNSDGDDAGTEPLFNFQSLASIIGVEGKEDQEDATRHVEHLNGQSSTQRATEENPETASLDDGGVKLRVDISTTAANGASNQTLRKPQRTTPEVILTPGTPAPQSHDTDDNDDKQLGQWTTTTEPVAREIAQ